MPSLPHICGPLRHVCHAAPHAAESLDRLILPVTGVRGLQQRSETMKTVCAVALVALAVGCHLDKLLTGAGNEGLSRSTPVGLVFLDITTGPPPPLAGATGLGFLDQPATTRAGGTIAPFRVVATDDAGNIATGFTGAIWITLGSNPETPRGPERAASSRSTGW